MTALCSKNLEKMRIQLSLGLTLKNYTIGSYTQQLLKERLLPWVGKQDHLWLNSVNEMNRGWIRRRQEKKVLKESNWSDFQPFYLARWFTSARSVPGLKCSFEGDNCITPILSRSKFSCPGVYFETVWLEQLYATLYTTWSHELSF